MKVRIKENAFVARLAAGKLKPARVAIVFGCNIYLLSTRKDEFLNDKIWVFRELKHVEQYQRYGFAGLIIRYVWECVRRGYVNNRFEAEARKSETNDCLLSDVQFI